MKLINKDALIEEIERRMKYNHERAYLDKSPSMAGREEEDKDILLLIDILGVKEVDDEHECKIFPRPIECYSTCKDCPFAVTNNKVQKGE